MPILVNDFKWKQTRTTVIITVPLHHIHQAKVNLYTSEKYIKASYHQYFFEVFLLHEIVPQNSKSTLTNSDIIFELLKLESIIWNNLELNLSRKDKNELRKTIFQKEHKRYQDECKEKEERKYELKRLAVKEQIAIDSVHHEKLNEIKKQEKLNVLGDLQNSHQQPEQLFVEKTRDLCIRSDFYMERKITLPLPRKMTTVHINFTERLFPTPSRESQLDEENDWLKKQTIVRQSVGFVSEDLRPEEKNPQYLKAKGIQFLKAENYLGAISAFSFGIKLCKEYPDLYIGRMEAHFKKENYYKCIQDSSTAIDLLIPAVSSNLKERVHCIFMRGLALHKLGFLKESISELEVAFNLEPEHMEIRNALKQTKEEFCIK